MCADLRRDIHVGTMDGFADPCIRDSHRFNGGPLLHGDPFGRREPFPRESRPSPVWRQKGISSRNRRLSWIRELPVENWPR